MTLRSSHLALAAAATLLLAGSAAAQDKEEKTIEKKVIIINGDEGDRGPYIDHLLADRDLDCHEADGKKICIAKIGPGAMGYRVFGSGTFLGVELTDSTPELREHLGGPRDGGVLISRVEAESPAALAGIEVGDIVTSVDGEAVASSMDLKRAIASRDQGDAVKIDLYRDGRAEQVTATLGKREPRMFTKHFDHALMLDSAELSEQIHQALEGIDLKDLDETVRKQLDSVDWEKIRETVRQALDQALAKDSGEKEQK